MMESLSVDYTYGEALFEVARDAGKTKEIQAELVALHEIFQSEDSLYEFVKTPTISAEDKKKAARAIFEGKISSEVLNFLYILIDKRRVFNFWGIAKAYKCLMDEAEGITYGEAYSVIELKETELARLEEEASKLLRKRVKLENKIDESLIGGVKIYVDGKLIDGSIKKRLQDLKEVLL